MPMLVKAAVPVLILALSLAGSVQGACPAGDLDGDCVVGLSDVSVFAMQWLEPPEQAADLNGDDHVNMRDFVILGGQWLAEGVPLVINEFMASNNSTEQDPQGEYDDWIEIYNHGPASIDIGGMYLTDELDEPNMWRIPDDVPSMTTIASGGHLLIWADGETSDSGLHAGFSLDADEEEVGLFDRDGSTLIDGLSFGEQETDISFGRYPDGVENWQEMASPTPGQANVSLYAGFVDEVKFSHKRGFYDSSFFVTLASETEGAFIYYTVDGSDPYELSGRFPNGYPYTGPIPITRTTCLRAKALKLGWKASDIVTQTYIFVSDVVTQSAGGQSPGSGWPVGNVNDQVIDYGMDPDVVGDPRYANHIDDALLSIPSISLVTKLAHLFDPEDGIYVNAQQEGRFWERPVSIELIDPEGGEGFHIEGGFRIRGGFSRSGGNPKHAFRLFFRPEYGQNKLKYPLFDDEGVDEFECVDLRTSQNYSWSFQGSGMNTMNRDVFSRDAQRAMGRPYTRSRYYHLYINGQYWGLYQSQERSEASFAESYFGGDKEDYDVVKNENSYIIATDGDMEAWRRLWNAVRYGVGNETYYRIQGLNTDGSRNPNYEVLLDVDNVIDYMLVIFYGGNLDAPISNFMGNNGVNNFSVIFNRNNPDGFKCFAHDSEHTLLLGNVVGQGEELYRDRTGPFPAGSDFNKFNPQWLHQQLVAHTDYRMRFADHVYHYFFNGGVLSPESAEASFLSRASEIEVAIIAESARWGDAKRSTPLTRDDHWLGAINNIVNTWLPARTDIVLGQLRNKGWYPAVEGPIFSHRGGEVASGYKLTMSRLYGTIYYTLDGGDPRAIGGSVNWAHATAYSGAVTITGSVHVKARVLSGGAWSPLVEATFAVGPVGEELRITEIMYHPEDWGGPSDANAEYIELKNIGAGVLNLNLVRFANGVDFTFGDIPLGPGQMILVVKDAAAFAAAHGAGHNIAGEYSGSLDNGGERVRLEDAIGRTILDFGYKDGWREVTDGEGFSLTIIDATNDDPNTWGEKASWRASAYKGGSAGWDDGGLLPNPGDVVINEVLAHSHASAPDWIELHNTTGADINIGGWFLSDSAAELQKYRIADGQEIPAHGYVVFFEDVNFGSASFDPGRLDGFGLSENGEAVYLSSAENWILTGYREVEDFGASATDESFGRHYVASTGNYNFVTMSAATNGFSNGDPKVGPVVISEIMYHPSWPAGGSYTNDQYEYIELHNIRGYPVTLYDFETNEPWKFTNGVEYSFGAGSPVTIAGGGYVIVAKNPAAFSWRYPAVPSEKVFGPYSGKLDDSGETLELSLPGDVDKYGVRHYIRVDRVGYSDGAHPEDCPGGVDLWPTEADGGGKSLTRLVESAYGNDVANWQAAEASPAE